MASEAAQWMRLDGLLDAACKDLAVGEMVQCETFNLFEAMSAVEVGNPKMDAAAAVSASVKELLDGDAAPLEPSAHQQLAIMERLLVLTTSHFCHGAPLAATVYTSLHMHMPRSGGPGSLGPVMAAFCDGLEQTCVAVRYLVFQGAVSEEEDFNLLITGLPPDVTCPVGGAALPDPQCATRLASAINQAQAAAAQNPQDASSYQAVAARLTYLKHLLEVLVALQTKTPPSLMSCDKLCASALSALDTCSGSSVPQSQVDAAPGFVPGLNRHLLGPAPPRAVQVPSVSEAWVALRKMVSELREAATVVHTTGYREVHQWIVRFSSLKAGVVARSAAHYLVAGKAWSSAVSIQPSEPPPLGAGAQQDTQQPHSRSNGSPAPAPPASVPWSLDRPLMCEALALPTSPSLGEEVETFLEQAVIAVGNWAQSMFLNPCRQRRRLRRGLEDWANLYQHALNADLSEGLGKWMSKAGWKWESGQAGPPHPVTGEPDLQGPLATWVAGGTAASQLLHLHLGFPLELYHPSEYCCIFWYCQHLLACHRVWLQLLVDVQAPAHGKLPLLPAKAGKGKSKSPPLPPSPATLRRQAGLLADVACGEVTTNVCVGLIRLMLGLQQAGLLPGAALVFNTDRERFDQRFGAFHAPNLVRPEPLTLDQYQEAIRTDGIPPAALLNMAVQSFNQVRRDCEALKRQQSSGTPSPVMEAMSAEQRADLGVLDRVAATNSLAATVLLKALTSNVTAQQGDGVPESGPHSSKLSVTVSFDFHLHPFYPTLKVKSK